MGASGMLGHTLLRRLGESFSVAGTVRGDPARWSSHPALGGARLIGEVDAAKPDGVARALDREAPDVVLNCIGMIKQAEHGQDPRACITLNALFPHQLAALCRERSVRLIHFSTDCVFSGRRGSYVEDDVPDATDVYGRSKALGEVTGAGCVTLRSSIIGPELARGASLLDWFLSQRGGRISGFAHAIFSGFTTSAMADVVRLVVETTPPADGLWHVSSDPISKYDLLKLVDRALGLGIRIDRDEAFHCDRSLDSSRFRRAFQYRPPSWPQMIDSLRDDLRMYAHAGL